ncbi:MAG TPA: hypothetical protein VKP30_00435, partial [Polyangiaceae bacterium]|nr:hypothetical protein [Polyangiaceae bacterium]
MLTSATAAQPRAFPSHHADALSRKRSRAALTCLVCAVAVTTLQGCDSRKDAGKGRRGSTAPSSDASALESSSSHNDEAPPQVLYLPDGGDQAIGSEFIPSPGPNGK